MKVLIKLIIIFAMALLINIKIYAVDGFSGYDSGISSGAIEAKNDYDYQEVQFISGKPVIFKGTVNIKKSKKTGAITSTYKYVLTNNEYSATLTRNISYINKINTKDNNQETQDIQITGKPSEIIVIDGDTYTMNTIDFGMTMLVDKKPAINYNVGNMWMKKSYTIAKADTGGNDNETTTPSYTLDVDITADIYGYNEYWGNTETIFYNYLIKGENVVDGVTDNWGGKADVTTSSSVSNKLLFEENLPEIISFDGGFINKQYNNNVLKYNSELPIFDQKGNATEAMEKLDGSITMESYPVQKRLISIDIPEIKGHWAEMDIRKLYGLEILKQDADKIKPEGYTFRGDYITRVYNVVKDVPGDPLIKTTTTQTNKNYESPFKDVPNDYPDIKEIVGAYEKGIILGRGNGYLGLYENIRFVDAVVILIRALGLENTNVTSKDFIFKDEIEIPDYAQKSIIIAQKIGLVKGDPEGYLKPNENLTNARSSALLVRFMEYMSEGLKNDYRNIIN